MTMCDSGPVLGAATVRERLVTPEDGAYSGTHFLMGIIRCDFRGHGLFLFNFQSGRPRKGFCAEH